MPTSAGISANEVSLRPVVESDLEAIICLLADDTFSREREFYRLPLPASYRDAFREICDNPDASLIIAERQGVVVGVLQMNLTTHLTFGGSRRATIEGVRVAQNLRGRGIGTEMLRHAISLAKEEGCNLGQLTTNTKRADARRFYERLGFAASHVGMKLRL